VIDTASYYSSSSSEEDDDEEELSELEDGSDYDDEEMDEEDECEEEDKESYCSSDFPLVDDAPTPTRASTKPAIVHTDSFKGRMKQILLWRERALAGESPTLKRKLSTFIPTIPESDPTSKRSRSSSSSASSASSTASSTSSHHPSSSASSYPESALAHRRYSTTSSISSAELEMHPCPACDAFFPTLTSLRAHGKATGNEACCVAVEYAFEQ